MITMEALHVRLEGFSASFRHPLIISGTQVSTPTPAYSNILGMISACAGRAVGPAETRVGFEFRCRSHDLELERKDRWEVKGDRLQFVTKKSVPRVLRLHERGAPPEEVPQGIGWRQVYWEPELDLYVTNLDLRAAFEAPAAPPCFGRSQDIAWIRWIRKVELVPVSSGALGPTLLPYPQSGIAGLIVRLPEWFKNDRKGRPRRAGPFGHYQAMLPTAGLRFPVARADLFHASDAEGENDAVYIHQWLNE